MYICIYVYMYICIDVYMYTYISPAYKAWVDFSEINFEAQLLSVDIAFGEALDASRCLLALRSCAPDAGLVHAHGARSATGRGPGNEGGWFLVSGG